MRRGRPKGKNYTKPGGRLNVLQEEFRKNAAPIIAICLSNWNANTDSFCSRHCNWKVIVNNPDTGKWWDRLLTKSRIRHGPPEKLGCHAIVVYEKFDENENGSEKNRMIQNTIKQLGESTEIYTITLLVDNQPLPQMIQEELETAISPNRLLLANRETMITSHTELRNLWIFQDANSDAFIGKAQNQTSSLIPLQIHEVNQICKEWSTLKWRWNATKIRDLYQRLRQIDLIDKGSEEELEEDKIDTSRYTDMPCKKTLYKLRQSLEKRALKLLENPNTEQIADYVLNKGAMKDENLFGRIHTLAIFSASATGEKRKLQKYLTLSNTTQKQVILNAYNFATCNNCTQSLEQLQFVSEPERHQFCIPVGDSATITVSLIPSLFPTGVRYHGTQINNKYDIVLGSRRIWEDHMALKASIIYLFQGQPGSFWDLTMQVINDALPRTWKMVLNEPPDEIFLRALLHPDIVAAGRLLHYDEKNTQQLPYQFEVMARIFALGRFIYTLDDPNIITSDDAVKKAIATTMKITQEQVKAIVNECKSRPLNTCLCQKIFQMVEGNSNKKSTISDKKGMTPRAIEVLGMLGVFLNHDRKSLRDASRFDISDFECLPFKTTKALIDCAMYCGTMKWISEGDEDKDGVWTCLNCLHRWQKRNPKEAYQTRKLMHPMTLTPFKREEYYDADDWDKIMEATDNDISKLGVDFYWGKCSQDGCGRICQALPRSGACAETDGVPLDDFEEVLTINDDYERIWLRSTLETMAPLGPNLVVTADCLEKYFDSEEKLLYLPGPLRRRVRNCIDRSTYILPRGLLCSSCASPKNAVDEYCPYCGTGFEPVFACVHYRCPQCRKSFCKACLGIDGIHYDGVYNARSHVCWRVLGNRHAYHNIGYCAKCNHKRPWPKSHALVSAGPQIMKKAMEKDTHGMNIAEAIKMQSANLKTFTDRYEEGKDIFLTCAHTANLGPEFCQCGPDV